MDYTYTAEYSYKADKVNYVLGHFALLITVYLVGASPGKYYFHWISWFTLVLFAKRLILFYNLGYQFYMLDYCYLCNYFTIVFIFWFPGSEFMYHASFAASGICFVIYLFKNMLVFHDFSKMTGALLHFAPTLTMWNIHWNIRGTAERAEWGFHNVDNEVFGLEFTATHFKHFMVYYLSWVVVYYPLIACLCWNYIHRNGLFSLIHEELYRGPFVAKANKKYGVNAGILALIVKHMAHAVVFAIILLPGYFIQSYCTLLTVSIIYLFFARGADYYIYYFPKNYVENLRQIAKLGRKYDPLGMRPKE